jgi:hypothetical protein
MFILFAIILNLCAHERSFCASAEDSFSQENISTEEDEPKNSESIKSEPKSQNVSKFFDCFKKCSYNGIMEKKKELRTLWSLLSEREKIMFFDQFDTILRQKIDEATKRQPNFSEIFEATYLILRDFIAGSKT